MFCALIKTKSAHVKLQSIKNAWSKDEIWHLEMAALLTQDNSESDKYRFNTAFLTGSDYYRYPNAKNHGVTQKEIAAIITHVAFYVGWPKGWAVFNLAKEVWQENADCNSPKASHQSEMVFPIGEPNDAFSKYFTGQSYLYPISTSQVGIYNVTFEPGCRNNWHIHHAKNGGGQILVCVAGRGYYQEWGKDAVEMNPGDCINIPPEIKHWHGAAQDSWFSHLAIEVPGKESSNEWLEPVTDEQYKILK